jgi:formamidopyrimidine-DNA glycosylase
MKELEKIAPDVLDQRLSYDDLKDRILRLSPSKTIDTVLMDQQLFLSGIGNIIKSEILYDAKISPKRKVSELESKDWRKILSSAKKIAHLIYSELQKEKDTNEFLIVQKIYQREYDPKGNKVERFMSSDGRVSFWVPAIQR